MITFLTLFILSALLSYWLIILFSKLFKKFNIMDKPHKYWYTRDPIPHSMGVIFFIWFFILSYIFIEHTYKLYLIWFFWLLITVVSFIDDRIDLSAKFRLVIQIIIWAIIWFSAIKVGYVTSIFGGVVNLETYNFELFNRTFYIIPILFTMFWYVFIFNVVNWSDWLQWWITSWVSSIAFFMLFIFWFILFWRDHTEWLKDNAVFVMEMSIIMSWLLFIFAFYDWKNKLLMWDSWTMFVWFMLATIAIIAWWKIATTVIVFWIYCVDSLYVIISRLLRKQSPLKWDKISHIHHRLYNIWISKKHILTILYLLSILFWILAIMSEKLFKII